MTFSNSWKPNLFKDRVVFCTGATGSICKQQVKGLVKLGANAFILGRNQARLDATIYEIQQSRQNSTVLGCVADVKKYNEIEKAVCKAQQELKRIDFVICGAAGNFLADLQNLSSNAFASVVAIDLLGTYNTCKATFEEMKKTKGIFIFVSAYLHYRGFPFQAHVSAAKAGVDALMQALAVEMGPFGIRVNCICPGKTQDTEGSRKLLPIEFLKKSPKEKAHIKTLSENDLAREIPLQKFGKISEIVDATIFLLSDAASYITGTVLVVDGGAQHSASSGISYPDSVLYSNEFLSSLNKELQHRAKL